MNFVYENATNLNYTTTLFTNQLYQMIINKTKGNSKPSLTGLI